MKSDRFTDARIMGVIRQAELPRVYRRAICSVIRQRYQVCSDLHRRRVRL
ncbi:hypothetical protein HNR55_003257, partial [Acetobacter lovaniensis]|nr:hypothetical protein [Acetobacter lovaniensis]